MQKSITVVTDVPESEPIRLVMKMEVLPIIDQTPPGLVVLRAAPGESARTVIRLGRRDGEPLTATELRMVDPELLQAELRQEDGESLLELQLVPQAEVRDAATSVQVVTGVAQLPLWHVQVRIWVRAPVVAARE